MYFIIALICIFIDQISKYYVSNKFELYKSIRVIDDILYLTYIKNAGAAFGILQNYQLLFIISSIIIITIIAYYFIITPKQDVLLRTSLILIISGGISNLIDRIRLGYVIDFIDIKIWPVFNIADSLVVIGSILLTYCILFKYK